MNFFAKIKKIGRKLLFGQANFFLFERKKVSKKKQKPCGFIGYRKVQRFVVAFPNDFHLTQKSLGTPSSSLALRLSPKARTNKTKFCSKLHAEELFFAKTSDFGVDTFPRKVFVFGFSQNLYKTNTNFRGKFFARLSFKKAGGRSQEQRNLFRGGREGIFRRERKNRAEHRPPA